MLLIVAFVWPNTVHSKVIYGQDYSPDSLACQDFPYFVGRDLWGEIENASMAYLIAKKLEYFKEIKNTCQLELTDFPNYKPTDSKIKQIESRIKSPENDCTKINLSSSLPPVRNQNDIGWCYAFSAADLLSLKLGENVSTSDVAMSYNSSWGNSDTAEAGNIFGAIKASTDDGKVCLERELPSTSYLHNGEIIGIEESFKRIENYTTVDELCNDPINIEIIEHFFPNTNLREIAKVITSMGRLVLSQLAQEACKEPIRLSEGVEMGPDGSDSAYQSNLQMIHRQLNSDNIVGVGYMSGVLSNPKTPKSGFAHASTVVGREWNKDKGTCDLLIRNSWGEDCTRYHESYGCIAKLGIVKIPQEVLKPSLTEITWIKQ